jgi:hypothetical protein
MRAKQGTAGNRVGELASLRCALRARVPAALGVVALEKVISPRSRAIASSSRSQRAKRVKAAEQVAQGSGDVVVAEHRLQHTGIAELDRHIAAAVAKPTPRGWRLVKSGDGAVTEQRAPSPLTNSHRPPACPGHGREAERRAGAAR